MNQVNLKSPSSTYAIEVIDLKKSFHQHTILKDISFNIKQGEIVGIVGKSGAGKTTLFRCLNALEKPDQGQILIEGKELTTKSARHLLQRMGTVFQNFNLLNRRTVLENILLPLEIQRQPCQISRAKAQNIATLVGLGQKMDAYPSQLSGGQKQRVAIARALVSEGSLLLCDEFTSALDPITTVEILGLLRKLNQKLGITILLITHDMSVVREICDRVIILDHGKIVETGTLEEIILQPQSAIAKLLLKSLINRELPNHLQNSLHTKPFEGCDVILRLLFSGASAHQPLVASLIEHFNVRVNIIAGNLGHIREHAVGALIIALAFEEEKIKHVKEYLKENGVAVDELGYGKWT